MTSTMSAEDAAVAAAQEGSLPALPDPHEYEAAVRQMEETVRAHYAVAEARVENARRVLAAALAQQQQLVDDYPQFFPERQASGRQKRTGMPTVEHKNLTLRAIAEHPGSTYKQLARRLGISASWVARIIQVINEGDATLVSRGRHGRSSVWTLTAEGEMFLNRGGFRGEAS